MVCDKPEWLTDPRFADCPSRLKNVDELEREIEAVFATQPTAHWVEKLDAADVPGGPVYRLRADPATTRTSRRARWWSRSITRKSAA